ncbi:MAG: BA14K family protein [Rhizobiaceae bacterium]
MNKLSKSIALVCALSFVPAVFASQANAAGVTSHINVLPAIAASDAGPIKVSHKLGHVLGGLAIGALIGGAIARDSDRRRYRRDRYYEPPRRSYSSRHVRWCYDRYRSYRDYDNSYQPWEGSRRLCRSPYY